MKNPRTLLYFVIALLVINVVFFTLWYALDMQGKVKIRIESALSKALKGQVTIKQLAFNDRHLTANKISYHSDDAKIKLDIRQVQIRYNLLTLLFYRFQIGKAVQEITVFEPEAIVNYNYKPKSKSKPKSLPDLTEYFQVLQIQDGKVNLTLTAQLSANAKDILRYKEFYHDISISVVNKKKSELSVSMKPNQGDAFKLRMTLNQGNLSKANLQVQQYIPYWFGYSDFGRIQTELSTQLTYLHTEAQTPPLIAYNTLLWNTIASYQGYSVQLPFAHIEGTGDRVNFKISESKLNTNKFSLQGKILQPFTNPYFDSRIYVVEANLAQVLPELQGTASAEIDLKGHIKDVAIKGKLSSPTISYKDYNVKHLTLNTTYQNKTISFSSDNLEFARHSCRLAGNFALQNKELSVAISSTPIDNSAPYNVAADLTAEIRLDKAKPYGEILVNKLDVQNSDYSFANLSGKVSLAERQSEYPEYLLDLLLTSTDGITIRGNGDLNSRTAIADIVLDSYQPAKHINSLLQSHVLPVVNGAIHLDMNADKVTGLSNLDLVLPSPIALKGGLSTTFAYNLAQNTGAIRILSNDLEFNDVASILDVDATIRDNIVSINALNVNNEFGAKGWINLSDWRDAGVLLKGTNLQFAHYWQMFDASMESPIDANVSIELDYNYSIRNQVTGYVKADSVVVPGIRIMQTNQVLSGTPRHIQSRGAIFSEGKQLVDVTGHIGLDNDFEINFDGQLTNADLGQILDLEKTSGRVHGDIGWQLRLDGSKLASHTFYGNVWGQKLTLYNTPIDSLHVNAAQLDDQFKINQLIAKTAKRISISGNGSVDFNLLRYSYIEGNHTMNLSLEGDVLNWINGLTDVIDSAKGNVKCQVVLRANEDGIHIDSGLLNLRRGMIKLKSQPESINNIEIIAKIKDDILTLEKCTALMGTGRIFIRNAVDAAGDNFQIGTLNLGYLLIRTDDNGIQLYVKDFMPKNTVTSGIISGQNRREATIKGPFDDMSISAEILCTNGNIVYPTDTKNIMQLIELFKTTFSHKKNADIPLPFTLDLLLRVGDNLRYVTYPANFTIMPESYIRITYDGSAWGIPEAEFSSEQGTLDFFGTVFDADFVRMAINEKQKLLTLNGTLLKKTPDGSLITLNITTNRNKGSNIWDQLNFQLLSDNPADRSTTQVLSRLRYSRNIDELTPDQRQNLLQDEAMQLIGSNLNTSIFYQVINPIENKIRRLLYLDSFTINTGFVQNLFVEYGSSNSDKATFNDTRNLNADIMQFSSAVFLNNLSISMGKYLGRSMFLDYQIQLQETTDLAKQTDLVLYHNATLRVNLPWQLRLAYTFSIKPVREENTHEIMLQRSFRF